MTEDMRSRVENILNSMLGTVDPADLLPAQSRVEAILLALDSKIEELGDLAGKLPIHICTSGEYNQLTGIPTIENPEVDIFYLVPDGTGNDLYTEWIYTGDKWEYFGEKSQRAIDAADEARESATNAAASAAAAQAVKDSIPADYTELSGRVDRVTTAMNANQIRWLSSWLDDYCYMTPTSVTTMPTDGYTTQRSYSCANFDCAPGDIFYLTGTGGSGAKLWVWTKADDTIISRAASDLVMSDTKMVAPAEAAHLLVNAKTTAEHYVYVGEKLPEMINDVKAEMRGMRYPIAYMANGRTFEYTVEDTGSFTLGSDICLVVNGVLTTITRDSVVTAAEAFSGVSVSDYTFSGASFSLLYDTNANAPVFVAASTVGYPSVNRYPTLFYHRYTSDTSGLLVEYAIRAKILELEKQSSQLPSYFETEAAKCRDEIEAASTNKSYVVGFLTDTHYPVGNNWPDTAATIKRVNELCPLDAIVHGGDIVHGNIAPDESKAHIRIVRDALLDVTPNLFMATGNHDDNLVYYKAQGTGFITRGERYAVYGRMSRALHRLDNTSNLYYDVPDVGLRVVVLDSLLDDAAYESASSYGYTSATVEWVRDVALKDGDDPTAYTSNHVIFFSHLPCTAAFSYGTASGPVQIVNGDNLKVVINTFVQNGGAVAGFIHGHTHWDNIAQAADSLFKEVCTGTARCKDGEWSTPLDYMTEGATVPERNRGTVTQELWDSIVISPSTRTVSLIRFGASGSGADSNGNRSYSY